MPLPFVGEQRARVVADLLGRFDAVRAPGGLPHLFVLEAPSGWGKTRIVQEFYAELSARQEEPAYWPASIEVSAHDELRAEGARKLTYPQVVHPPSDAVPHWFWWGLSAMQRQAGATPVQALAQDLTQFEAHSRALERRWRQVTGRSERVKDIARRRRSEFTATVGAETFSAAAGAGIEQILNATVPGLGLLWWAGQRGWERHVGARPTEGPIELDDRRTELVSLLAEQVVRFAASGIPVVIAVEDVHAADSSLIDFLLKLLSSRSSPILVVATGWPGLLEQDQRLAHRLLRGLPKVQITRLTSEQLRDLTVDESKHLSDVLLPEASAADRWLLAERFANPQALQLALGLERIRRAVTRGTLVQALANTPTEVLGLYREMWRELPQRLRVALALAVTTTPASLGTLFDSRAWDTELTVRGATALPWLEQAAADLHHDLEIEAPAYAWVRPVDAWLRICQELDQHLIADEAARDLFEVDERLEFHQRIAECIDLTDSQSASRQRSRAQLLVALAAEGVIDWTPPAVAAADLLIEQASHTHDADSLETVIRLAAIAPAPDDPLVGLQRAAHTAFAYGRLGRHGEAVQRYNDLLEAQRSILQPDDAGILATRANRAQYEGYAGNPTGALAQLTQVLHEQEATLGRDHPDCLATRHLIAHFLGQRNPRAAIEEYVGLVEDRQRLLGALHPDTLRSRNNLARFLGRRGDYGRAISELTELLHLQERALDSEHPQALTTRSNLAHFHGLDGDNEGAIEAYEKLSVDRRRILGVDHPETLIARANLARFRGEAGDHAAAIEELSDLLVDRRRVLGDDHPRTLLTRTLLARFHGEAGDCALAIRQLMELREDQRRLLGDVHPHTMTTRQHLARFQCESGEHEVAQRGFVSLLEDRRSELGGDHVHTLTTRQLLAACLAEAGEYDIAITQLTDLLTDQRRVLPHAHHPSIERSRSLLARYREVVTRNER